MREEQRVIEWLNKFPEVTWDRFTNESLGNYWFFGWIEREDQYKDFCVLEFSSFNPISFSSSSAKYSAEFAHRLNLPHNDCMRVEFRFGNEVKSVKLEAKKQKINNCKNCSDFKPGKHVLVTNNCCCAVCGKFIYIEETFS